MHYLSANRDEDVFDAADEFDVTRADAGHAAFGGGGTHFCLGAQLARLELRVMLEELYPNVPGLTVTGRPTGCGRRSSTASNDCRVARASYLPVGLRLSRSGRPCRHPAGARPGSRRTWAGSGVAGRRR